MPLIPCKKCVFAVAPADEQTNHRCHRKAPGTSDQPQQKTYWRVINIEIEGCGEGELKPSKK